MRYGLDELVIERINGVFAQFPEIDSVVLYGSRAKGNWKHGSDIDLCIKGEHVTLPELLMIENRIDDLLLPYKVDLTLLHKVENPDLQAHIQRIGAPFYVRSAQATSSDSSVICRAA